VQAHGQILTSTAKLCGVEINGIGDDLQSGPSCWQLRFNLRSQNALMIFAGIEIAGIDEGTLGSLLNEATRA
jgi:hypothetical protein